MKKQIDISDQNNKFIASFINAMRSIPPVVIKQARLHNTPIISWKNGKIVEVDPFSIELEEDKK